MSKESIERVRESRKRIERRHRQTETLAVGRERLRTELKALSRAAERFKGQRQEDS